MQEDWEQELDSAIVWENHGLIEELLGARDLHRRDASGKSWLAKKFIQFKKDDTSGSAGDVLNAAMKFWLKSYDSHHGVMDVSAKKSQHWLEYILTAPGFSDHTERFKVRYSKLIPDDLLTAHSQVLADHLEQRGMKRDPHLLIHHVMSICLAKTGDAPHFKALMDATLHDRRLQAIQYVYEDNHVMGMHAFEKQGGDLSALLPATRMNLRHKPLSRYLKLDTSREAQVEGKAWFEGLKISTFGALFLAEGAVVSNLMLAGMDPRKTHYEWEGRPISVAEISLAYEATATKTALADSHCEELNFRLKSLSNAEEARLVADEILGLRASLNKP